MPEDNRDPFWNPSGKLYDPAPTSQKHGYTFAQIKLWRQQQFERGNP